MRGAGAVLAAGLVGLLLAGCAGDGAPPSGMGAIPAAAPSRSLPPRLADAPPDDLQRVLDYSNGRADLDCLSPAIQAGAETLTGLLPVTDAAFAADRRDATLARLRGPLQEAERALATCTARRDAVPPPRTDHAGLREMLSQNRAAAAETKAVVDQLLADVRQIMERTAGGRRLNTDELADTLARAGVTAIEVEIRFRQLRLAMIEEGSIGYLGNLTRIAIGRAQMASLRAGLSLNPDSDTARRGLEEMRGVRAAIASERVELRNLVRTFANLAPAPRAASREFLDAVENEIRIVERIATALEDYFRTGERARSRELGALYRELGEADRRTQLIIPEFLRQLRASRGQSA